jgi:hypothetical protein
MAKKKAFWLASGRAFLPAAEPLASPIAVRLRFLTPLDVSWHDSNVNARYIDIPALRRQGRQSGRNLMRGAFAAADGFSDGSRAHDESRAQSCRRACGFHPLETAAIILGFIFYWPIGLALLALKLWRGKNQPLWPAEAHAWGARAFSGGFTRSGNSAFDEWKRAELDRLEAERRKLSEAERDFAFFLDQLRKAKDREEFERFMAARRAATQDGSGATSI